MERSNRTPMLGIPALGLVTILSLGACAGADPASTAASQTANSNWESVLAAAKGQTVDLWMYGGDPQGNAYIDNVLAPAAAKLDVTLRRVPITDTKDALNRILAEQQAGRTDGSVDLVWVNGNNFSTGQQAKAWACDWVQTLPNARFLNPTDPLLVKDFGVLTGGCEAPWHKAQFTLVYDSAKLSDPPSTFAELFAWARKHPGRFTYPAPPDFTGSVFVREALYSASGGVENVPSTFSQSDYDRLTPALYSTLQGLKSSLWRGGSTYPRDQAELDKLYAGGQVDFSMTYGPATLTSLVDKGALPATTKVLTLDEGTVGNASFLGLAANAADSAGAKVVANLAMSPEQQAAKADPQVWGQFTVLDVSLLSPADRALFEALPASKVVPPYEVLARNANPELNSGWVGPLDAGWRREVLGAG